MVAVISFLKWDDSLLSENVVNVAILGEGRGPW